MRVLVVAGLRWNEIAPESGLYKEGGLGLIDVFTRKVLLKDCQDINFWIVKRTGANNLVLVGLLVDVEDRRAHASLELGKTVKEVGISRLQDLGDLLLIVSRGLGFLFSEGGHKEILVYKVFVESRVGDVILFEVKFEVGLEVLNFFRQSEEVHISHVFRKQRNRNLMSNLL